MSDRKFYTFNQNNSGGSFDYDNDVAHIVVIEATSGAEANRTAQDIVGIYFDGCEKGMDCPCCGDRWYPCWDDEEGDDEPMVYDTPLAEYKDCWGDYAVLWSYDDDGQITPKKIHLNQKKIEG